MIGIDYRLIIIIVGLRVVVFLVLILILGRSQRRGICVEHNRLQRPMRQSGCRGVAHRPRRRLRSSTRAAPTTIHLSRFCNKRRTR